MKNLILGGLALLLITLFTGCDLSGNKEMGTFKVFLTDAPANYESLFIDIREVRIHKSNSANEQDDGWITIRQEPMVVDLLELTNGNYEILGDIELEQGRYSQLRLVLGDQNVVVIDGEDFPLTTPSAQQSGLKLQINADVESGSIYTLLLDFDASRSIIRAGSSGKYILKPMITASRLEETGQITGSVEPATALPWVYAIVGSDTLRSTKADADGDFLLIGLTNQSYKISLDPTLGNFDPVSLAGVEVNVAETTRLGTVYFKN